ncbi:MAG: TlpA family protein disulfide reductase [Saprospirales bacterium]|nr:TlpA family protein disulfide reductase [Saprospirales bacterium]
MEWRHLGAALSLIALSLTWGACNSQLSQTGGVSVSGVIELDENWAPTLYLLRPTSFPNLLAPYQMPVVATIELAADGSFHWEKNLTPEEEGLYVLLIQKKGSKYQNAIESLPMEENYVLLSLQEGTQINLQGQAARLTHSCTFSEANEETRLLAQLQIFREPLVREIEKQYAENTDPDGFQWNMHGNEEVAAQMNAGLDGFIETCNTPLPILAALRLRAPDNEYRDRPEFFLEVSKRLKELAPGHPWVAELDAFLTPDNLPVLKGDRMPDFALPTPEGDTLRLADTKGKLVLVDFWASWCAPCRKEVRETIRPLYEEYHDEGFEVLGISIDSDRRSWLNAIAKDGAVWLHASDLMGDESPVRESLKFEFIPACYLLDEDGKLVARNLHGEELRRFLADYF